MPCPHNEITIVQRSQRQSAVAAAAYQSGEKLFCEYDQQVKHYPEKRGIVHNEILLPANAPPEYADRNTLWNAAEAVEKQWNSQLARRWVLTIPREILPDQYAVLVREFCEQQFVSKGMIADFAIHDPHPPGHNPHAHVLLTMRAMDEHGKWLPKSRKVYDLDDTGTILSVPVTACAHVEETAEEAQAEQEGNLGNTTLQSEKEETVPEQKTGSEEEQTGENQKKDVNAFSTAGNGQVQDSIGDSSTKEFYTIKTKNNNTYYLVIDHANNIDNVYMLSEIDENDLKQFLSEDTTSGISSSVTAGIVLDEEQKKSKNINSVESEEQKSDSKKEKTKDAGTVVGYGAFAVMIVIGVAVGYYFKVYKPKKAGEETPDEGLEEREDYETYEE